MVKIFILIWTGRSIEFKLREFLFATLLSSRAAKTMKKISLDLEVARSEIALINAKKHTQCDGFCRMRDLY
jgi:hypothetical protein